MPAPPTIEATGLSKTFGRMVAVDRLDLAVERGTFLSIFGPNGAGKTTLLGLLAGLSRPSAGRVRIEGLDVWEEAARVRGRIGVISHQPFLYDELTAAENLRFYGAMYGVPDLGGRIAEALEGVGLAHRRDGRVGTFSRGMKQRLSIARATLHDPPILLLDEPYTGLDEGASTMLSGLLRDLATKGRTVVMVTHDLERGLEMADRVALLYKGRFVYQARSDAISPQTFKETYRQAVGVQG